MGLEQYGGKWLPGMCREFLRGKGSNVKKGQYENKKYIYIYIGQKIGYITNSYFCKKSLIVIKLTFIWSKFLYTSFIYFIYLMRFMKCWFISNAENLW